MPSFTTIIYVIFVAYVGNSIWTIYQLFTPPTCTQASSCATPFLKSNPPLVLALYTSTKMEVRSDSDLSTLWQSEQFDYKTPLNVNVNVTLPRSTRLNGTLYVHAFVGPKFNKHGSSSAASFLSSPYASYSSAALTVFMVPEAEAFSLLGSSKDGVGSSKDKKENQLPVAHWRQKLILSVMEELVSFPLQSIPRELAHFMRLSPKKEYLPMLYIDTLQSRIADLKPINKNSSHMELSIAYNPISYGRLRLQMQFQSAMQTMSALGFTEKDTDEVKGIFLDTNLYLLCITFIVAAFHLLFDFLAFKNDIIFWRRKKTLVGTSTRSVIWRCFSHAVIFVYLMDEKTSMIVLIPAGIATLIEVWKMAKVLKVSVRKTKWFYTLKFGELSAEEKKTEEYDAQCYNVVLGENSRQKFLLLLRILYLLLCDTFVCLGIVKILAAFQCVFGVGRHQKYTRSLKSMKYLSYLLYPLCMGGAIYSLLYTPHRSWYSWCIQSLVNGVYVFGFLFMLPQLFVNYKLKSVAHLPWKAFMYKAFNTFIDDIFAFIITMPTAHRVACFRDDVIFLIYLYQRWLYPVDKSRVNEFGETFDGESDEKKKKNKKSQ